MRSQRIDPPFDFTFRVDPLVFNANDLLVLVIAPIAILGIGLFLQRTSVGVAIRAAADRADRASLLGVPVKNLHTIVWAIAGMLAFLALFLRAGMIGLPIGSALSLDFLVRALAALIIGRMTHLPTITGGRDRARRAGDGRGLERRLRPEEPAADPAGHLPRRGREPAAAAQGREPLRDRRGVVVDARPTRCVRCRRSCAASPRCAPCGSASSCSRPPCVLYLPHWVETDTSLKISVIFIFTLVVVSVVVITGWAGQVSLCQVAFMAVGATVGARATNDWGLDLLLALPLAGIAGLVAAVLVGLPALACEGPVPGRHHARVRRGGVVVAAQPALLRLDPHRAASSAPTCSARSTSTARRASTTSAWPWWSLVLLGLTGIRHSRTGRVLLAMRENERGAQAYGVSVVRAKLTAFGISGFVSAVGGALFIHHQQAFDDGAFGPGSASSCSRRR